MLVIQIAFGIVLACVAIALFPIIFGCTLGALAHVVVALAKPRRGIVIAPAQSSKQWAVTSVVQVVAVFGTLGVLVLASKL